MLAKAIEHQAAKQNFQVPEAENLRIAAESETEEDEDSLSGRRKP